MYTIETTTSPAGDLILAVYDRDSMVEFIVEDGDLTPATVLSYDTSQSSTDLISQALTFIWEGNPVEEVTDAL